MERIKQLNRAGLEHLQISIDNVQPDEVSKKSLKVLDKKLEWLAEHATFDVSINSVVGAGVAHPEDALAITRRALELGFDTTVGTIRDHRGNGSCCRMRIARSTTRYSERAQAGVLGVRLRQSVPEKSGRRRTRTSRDGAAREAATSISVRMGWWITARSSAGIRRFLWRSKRLAAEIEREYTTKKSCAPFCTVSCVHRVEMIDMLRNQPREALDALLSPGDARRPGAAARRESRC